MKWEEITIDFTNLDLLKLYSDWSWLIAGKFRPIMMSKFGDLFFERENGRIFFLDTLEGTVEEICQHNDEFVSYINVAEHIEVKLLSNLVHDLIQHGKEPQATECYTFKVLPILGGKIESENVIITLLSVGLSITGQIHRQVKKPS